MDGNDDIFVEGTHLNYFQMHRIFEQIYPKPAIVPSSGHERRSDHLVTCS